MKHELDHEFFREISKYETGMFLQVFASLNTEVFKGSFADESGMQYINMADYGLAKKGKLHLCHWTIRDIIFQKFRRGNIVSQNLKHNMYDRDVFYIIGLYNNYEDELDRLLLKDDHVFYSLFGLAEQQFRSQLYIYKEDMKRNNIILNRLDDNNFFDVNHAVRNMLGMEFYEFRFILLLMFSLLTRNGFTNPYLVNISDDVIDDMKFPDFEEKYQRVIKYYTMPEKFLLENTLNLARYKYLFVEFEEKCVLVDGCMLEEKLADSVMWLLRDYYQMNTAEYGKEYFPNHYGILFERYIEYITEQEKVSEFLYNVNDPDNMAIFFNTTVGKKVDFVLETKKYRIIIECKSGIKPIAAKDSHTNTQAIIYFLDKVFDKGAGQILNAIKNSNDTEKILIGMIVHSEKSFTKKVIKSTYLDNRKKNKYDGILLLDIYDFELLVNILKEDDSLLDEIITEYIHHASWDFDQIVENRVGKHTFLDKIKPFKNEEFERYLTKEALSHKL